MLANKNFDGMEQPSWYDGKMIDEIARILDEKQILTAKALYAKRKGKPMPEGPCHWENQSIVGILERLEYTGCACNFKTYSKSYKLKKRIPNDPENMFYLPDTQEAIISQRNGRDFSPVFCSVPIAAESSTLLQVRA